MWIVDEAATTTTTDEVMVSVPVASSRSSGLLYGIWCIYHLIWLSNIFRACIFIHTASIICELYTSVLFFLLLLDIRCIWFFVVVVEIQNCHSSVRSPTSSISAAAAPICVHFLVCFASLALRFIFHLKLQLASESASVSKRIGMSCLWSQNVMNYSVFLQRFQ